jgi:hypothetical protein
MSMYKVTQENYIEAATGLHWYCVENHGGQDFPEYRVQYELGYTPGVLERGVEEWSEAEIFYNALDDGDIEIETLLRDIQAIQKNED